ncbi:uncharacterized protein FA14DRAFT_169617 [Meira miltonrushii]|uniref:Succinate dehydrogenase [ubiquinone] cytochrome b small subunit n=1 Tax=Meira miltonrushii TaxID=1280837 RepID=A0A316VGC9_9BASI|nr:uncharacterized protein FA14DRAFT_169617 [Meira miltonrushii]PWN36642.1 hypothetical protein FA14DRAFT_169617 [Meira miltonrushii]
MAALRQGAVNLKLSAVAGSPHLRMMATGARAFSTGRVAPVQNTQSRNAATVAPNAKESYIKGTVNEPTTFPPPHPTHGSYHWAFERAISVALVPLIAVGAVKHGASGILDATLALTLVLHSHIGFTASLDDYLHPRKFPKAGPFASWTLRAATVATLAGIYEFQTNDVGFTELISRVWTA